MSTNNSAPAADVSSSGQYTSKPVTNHYNFGSCEYTPDERNYLQTMLSAKLQKDDLSSRPGPGGGRVTYIEAWRAIEIANKIIGFNGWSSQIVDISTDYLEHNTQTGRFSCGCSAIIRVTLKDGSFHEDCGCGSSENQPKKAMAIESAKKKAISDGLKRALKNFGNALGLSIYDHEHVKKVNDKTKPGVKKPGQTNAASASGATTPAPENTTVTSMGDNPFFKTEHQTFQSFQQTSPIVKAEQQQTAQTPQNMLNVGNESTTTPTQQTNCTTTNTTMPTGFLNINNANNPNTTTTTSPPVTFSAPKPQQLTKPMFAAPKNPPKPMFGNTMNKQTAPTQTFANNNNNTLNSSSSDVSSSAIGSNQSPNNNINNSLPNQTNSPPLLSTSSNTNTNSSAFPSQSQTQQTNPLKRTFGIANSNQNLQMGPPQKKPRTENGFAGIQSNNSFQSIIQSANNTSSSNM